MSCLLTLYPLCQILCQLHQLCRQLRQLCNFVNSVVNFVNSVVNFVNVLSSFFEYRHAPAAKANVIPLFNLDDETMTTELTTEQWLWQVNELLWQVNELRVVYKWSNERTSSSYFALTRLASCSKYGTTI